MSIAQPTNLFRNLAARQVQHLRDVDGRPLGEQRAEGYDEVATELVRCPYAGSRHQHPNPMNISALRQIRSGWDEMLQLLNALGSAYCSLRGTTVRTDLDLYYISSSGVHLLDFLRYRQNSGQDLVISRALAGLYKVCLGFQFALFQRCFDASLADGDCSILPADEFYEDMDARGRLVGSKEVCAGPENLIKEAYQALSEPDTNVSGELPSLDVSADQVTAFSFHFSRYWYNSLLFLIVRTHLTETIAPLLSSSADARWSKFQESARMKIQGHIFEDLEILVDQLSAADGFGRLGFLSDDSEVSSEFSSQYGSLLSDSNALIESIQTLQTDAQARLSADLTPAINLLGYECEAWQWNTDDWRYWSLWTAEDLLRIANEPHQNTHG